MKTPPRPAIGLAIARARRKLKSGSASLALALSALALAACSDPPKAIESNPVLRDTPSALRGTIGAEVTFRGIEPVVVSGLGLVVNLNNTGGKPLPDRILETMERNLTLMGVSSTIEAPGTALHGKTARDVLNDPRTAVVIVQAAIPPGSPTGAKFDVYVEAVNASSLEGGQLWTTPLRLGETVLFGQVQARQIAEARGAVFINPFAEKEVSATPDLSQTSGRILDGGIITTPLQIEMVPDTSSHNRVASMVSAINSRLPQRPGDREPTARGKATSDIQSGPSVVLTVPRRYADRPAEFLNIIRHLAIDTTSPEALAKRYVDSLKSDPQLATQLAWCLEALGDKCLPFVRGLYDYGEAIPRLAALRAGARLGDPMAAAPLMQIASAGEGVDRLDAIALLAEVKGTPKIDLTLRTLLAEKDLLTRVAAYEALAKRAERLQLARSDYEAYDPASPLREVSALHREILAKATLPPGMVQGIERRNMGGKFFLDLVPIGEPLIYVTQQGQPRIVLFGENPSVHSPCVVAAWGDRLMLNSDARGDAVRVMYRPDPVSSASRVTLESRSLDQIIQAFAAPNSPDQPQPGLDFTYSDVVGALYAISNARATDATFATERDRLKAGILAVGQTIKRRDRPETPEDPQDLVVLRRPDAPDSTLIPTTGEEPPKIMPLPGSGEQRSEGN